jgi:hypothetical protein
MRTDRFGNRHAPNLSYARGNILRSTEGDFQKLQVAWSLIRRRGPDRIYVFTGLEHGLPLAAEELQFADDELAPAEITLVWKMRGPTGRSLVVS